MNDAKKVIPCINEAQEDDLLDVLTKQREKLVIINEAEKDQLQVVLSRQKKISYWLYCRGRERLVTGCFGEAHEYQISYCNGCYVTKIGYW